MNIIATFITPSRESQRIFPENGTLIIGRDDNADLQLDHPEVSRKHAKLIMEENRSHFLIEDMRSANGTYIEGIPIKNKTVLHPDQSLNIGPYKIQFCISPNGTENNQIVTDTRKNIPEKDENIIKDAVNSLSLFRNQSNQGEENKGKDHTTAETEKFLYKRILELLPASSDIDHIEQLTNRALQYSLGLGPLEDWLDDPEISEIMINGVHSCYLEKMGALIPVTPPFKSESAIMRIIDRILAPIGRRVDESSPFVDGRLPDGSRLNIIVPPISLMGPVLTIRKFPSERLSINSLIEYGTLTGEAARLLNGAVNARRNILISGGTGTGKTTLLNALASFIPDEERIITIEDAAELNLHQEHVVRLETKPPNIENSGEISPRDLVRNSLRMRPDRIIVGECRGGEALDMLQAMNTGHEGSMTTCHSNSPRDALRRIETMALMSGLDIPHQVVREQVATAIHIIVQIDRLSSGGRVVSSIVEVDGMEGNQILIQPLFQMSNDGGTRRLTATKLMPSFMQNEKSMRDQLQSGNSIK